MGKTGTLIHHARAATLSLLAETYKHNALAMAHLEQNAMSQSNNRETREMDIFKQGQGRDTQERKPVFWAHILQPLALSCR